MINDKKTISLVKCFALWLAAPVATGAAIGIYNLCSTHPVIFSPTSEIFYLLQGSSMLIAVFWVLSLLGINIRNAICDSIANIKSDLVQALKYFFIYAAVVSATLLCVVLICMVLIKTGTIAQSDILTWFNKPTAIEEGQNYLRNILLNSPFKLASYFLATCVLIPIEEEIFYRRFVYVSLRQKISFLPALLISSLMFSAAHLAGAVPALAAGLLLGWLYEKRENLPVNIMVHGLINFSVNLLLIFLL
jgi:membrane protease YdiL (CAAX protease family)